MTGADPERYGEPISVADHAGRDHVGAVADPRRVVADRCGGDAELLQVIEPANPGLVAPDRTVDFDISE